MPPDKNINNRIKYRERASTRQSWPRASGAETIIFHLYRVESDTKEEVSVEAMERGIINRNKNAFSFLASCNQF